MINSRTSGGGACKPTHLAELIERLCPDGVEYKPLGELLTRVKGIPITAGELKKLPSGDIRIFGAGNTYADVAEECIPPAGIIRETAILIKSRGIIGFEYCNFPYSHKNELWSYIRKRKEVVIKYVFYYLVSKQKYFQERARATSVKLPQLAVRDTDYFKIPVPPLEVQEEIVRILDKFTALEAELEAELAARRLQYAHYRDELLRFSELSTPPQSEASKYLSTLLSKYCPDGVAFKSLRELGELVRGKGLPKSMLTSDGVGAIHYGQLYTYYGVSGSETLSFVPEKEAQSLTKAYPGDVIFTNTSENISDVLTSFAWLGNEPIVIGGHATVLRHTQCPKYIAYWFRSNNLGKDKRKYVYGTKVVEVSGKQLEKIKIPVPPLEVQERIVEILDRFDALVNDISVGLPAELKARRKQYEYYRDRLLTFKELEK